MGLGETWVVLRSRSRARPVSVAALGTSAAALNHCSRMSFSSTGMN